jgi:SdrD B-like protein
MLAPWDGSDRLLIVARREDTSMSTPPVRSWVSRITVLAGIAALLTACGGGGSVSGPSGSSGSGGSGTATVQGQVLGQQGAAASEPVVVIVLQGILGIRQAEADTGTPVAGVTVNLLKGGVVVATTTTDSHGQFVFQGVQPGIYTVQVGTAVSAPFTVGAGDQAVVGVATSSGTPPTVTVTAMSTDVYNNDAQLGHAINIANASASCDLVGVTQLRAQGLGWGEIAHRCGVGPGVIGLGRSNLSDADLEDARDRTGHGRGNAGGGNGNGNGGNGKGNGGKGNGKKPA